MNRIEVLLESPLLTLARYDHPPDAVHRDPDREVADDHALAFVERGSFEVRVGGRGYRLSSGSLFVKRPGLAYRCRHVTGADDVCLSIRLPRESVADLERVTGRRWSHLPPVLRITNRLSYLRHRLLDSAAWDDRGWAAHDLAADLLIALDESRSGGVRLHRGAQIAWYAKRIEAARRMLGERYAEPLSLDSVARETGMSPFHFSRVFSELVGLPPHRYLVKVRLARAAQRLKEGDGVTQTCFATGFNNLSHFIRAFRRAYGVSPSHHRS